VKPHGWGTREFWGCCGGLEVNGFGVFVFGVFGDERSGGFGGLFGFELVEAEAGYGGSFFGFGVLGDGG